MTRISEHQPPYADALRPLCQPVSPDRLPTPGIRALRWLLPAMLLAGGAASGLTAFWPRALAPVASVTAVTPTPAIAAPTLREITGAGYVVAPARAAVFATQPGQITRVLVQEGEWVSAGQPLILLRDIETDFALQQAQAAERMAVLDLAARRIEAERARAELERSAALAKGGAVTARQLEAAQTSSDLAANALLRAGEALQAAVLTRRIAAHRQSELTLRAPLSGVVTRLDARPGERVLAQPDAPDPGQSLLTITDTANLVIDADFSETGLALLHPGQRGEAVLDAWPGQPFAVEIARIAPVITPEKGTLSLRLRLIDPPPGMRPAMAARIRFPETPTEGPAP